MSKIIIALAAYLSFTIAHAEQLEVNLPKLQDAWGLAILGEDSTSAKLLEQIVSELKAKHGEHESIRANQESIKKIFFEALENKELKIRDTSLIQEILDGYFKEALYAEEIFSLEDLRELSVEELNHFKTLYENYQQLKGLDSEQSEWLNLRYRDRLILRLHEKNRALKEKLTQKTLNLPEKKVVVVKKYFKKLENLKKDLEDSKYSCDKRVTLRGLLNGLSFLPHLSELCKKLELDFKIMLRLFIQESRFIHERVSPAKAYGLAQLTDIAIKELVEKKLVKENFDELKKKVLTDPYTAMETGLIYFKSLLERVRKEVENKRTAYAITLAQYNAGAHRTRRARKLQKNYGLPIRITETRNFVNDILNGSAILDGIKISTSDFNTMCGSEIYQEIKKILERKK